MTAHSGMYSPLTITGTIVSVQGSSLLAQLPQASLGDLCWLTARDGRTIWGQVVSFQNSLFSVALFDEPVGLYPGLAVRTRALPLAIPVGRSLLGRVINPLGLPLADAQIALTPERHVSIFRKPPSAATRPPITEPFQTGISAIDGFCTLGRGQRIAICASAGVGKSTLLASMTQRASADVIVVALVGERGREVREFIDNALGPEGLKRSVIVVATSDDSSLLRQTAPYTATAIAEYFRDQGLQVLLIVDSLTRMARAIRETSIAAGELPVRQGYTNSVYMQLPRLLERAGTSPEGSITALYTVLTNQDDDTDPLADEVKSLLDGHIVLRQDLALQGVFPAIDVTASVSRLFERVTDEPSREVARSLRYALGRLWKERDLILMGGTPDAELKKILQNQETLLGLIRQDYKHGMSLSDTHTLMREARLLLQ